MEGAVLSRGENVIRFKGSLNHKNMFSLCIYVFSSNADSHLKVLRYPPLRHLPSPQYTGDYWNFIHGAHSKEILK